MDDDLNLPYHIKRLQDQKAGKIKPPGSELPGAAPITPNPETLTDQELAELIRQRVTLSDEATVLIEVAIDRGLTVSIELDPGVRHHDHTESGGVGWSRSPGLRVAVGTPPQDL